MKTTSSASIGVNLSNSFLIIGIINHVIFLIVVYRICAVSDFSCRGDAAGAEGMAYAFSLLIPQLVVEGVTIVTLALLSVFGYVQKANIKLAITFLGSLATVCVVELLA